MLTAIGFLLCARQLGPSRFGELAAAYGGASFVATAADFGSSSLSIRAFAQDATVGALHLATPRLRARLLIACCGAAPTVVFGIVAAKTLTLVATAGVLGFWMAAQANFLAPLRGRNRFWLVSGALCADRLVFCILSALAYFFHYFNQTPLRVLQVLILTTAVGSAVALLSSISQIRLGTQLIKMGPMANPWGESINFGMGSLATATSSLDNVLIDIMGGAKLAGVYGAVSRWTTPVGLLASGVCQSAFTELSRLGPGPVAGKTFRIAAFSLAPAVAFLTAVAIFAPEIVDGALGSAYHASGGVLRILALAVIPAVFNQLYSVRGQAFGHERSVSRMLLLYVPTELALVTAFASLGRLYIAVASTLLLQLCLLCVFVFSSRRWVGQTPFDAK